ncbi:hypothetical protein MCHI_001297 [Candidatus Magnetoovum chiemensis]|nr:hypothetical protein MCHI_001297 [Candidatus Magnetoovum chiemensis]
MLTIWKNFEKGGVDLIKFQLKTTVLSALQMRIFTMKGKGVLELSRRIK